MLSPIQALRRAVARVRPRPRWWLGTPLRATIAPAASGGYLLLIHCTQGTEWVRTLPRRNGTPDRPDEGEFAAVADALTARGLTRTSPWHIDSDARLCTDITTTRATGKEDRRG
ncbi:hypothetical protein [Salinispora vitiensis]|uniref:hypothetical protein n=1 Tax=Salinispora vitiensis TaxID=999544 RepID=UPI00037F3F3E|nr:hypothetical protein [Salinispora vitiensis]